MLVLSRKPGAEVVIDGYINLTVIGIFGKRVRLMFEIFDEDASIYVRNDGQHLVTCVYPYSCEVSIGEIIGVGKVMVTFSSKHGCAAKIGFEAPKSIKIQRKELL